MISPDRVRVLRWRSLVEAGARFHVARPRHTRRSLVARHTHDFAELFWVDAGEGWHLINGRRVSLNVGDVWFVSPTDVHEFELPAGGALSITNVAFQMETVEFLRARYFASNPAWWWGRTGVSPLRVEPSRLYALNAAADRLALAPRDRLAIEFFLLGVFSELGAEPVELGLNGAPEWLTAACRGIRQPEHFRGGVQAFFRLASKSPEHVARVARRILGVTPSDYVNRVRLAHAAFQLRMTARPVTEIALDSGYENLGYFFHTFKKEYGCSPRHFREKAAQPWRGT